MGAILERIEPRRYDEPTVPLLFAVDHCFSIRGQGTILTGTVLQGQVTVGQTVELPAQRLVKKVKSMQMFRRPVTEARRGDRVGVCIAQLDASVMERGLVAEPGSVPTLSCAVCAQLPVRCSSHWLTHSMLRRWLPWRKFVSSRARFPQRHGSTSPSATSRLWLTSSSSPHGRNQLRPKRHPMWCSKPALLASTRSTTLQRNFGARPRALHDCFRFSRRVSRRRYDC